MFSAISKLHDSLTNAFIPNYSVNTTSFTSDPVNNSANINSFGFTFLAYLIMYLPTSIGVE